MTQAAKIAVVFGGHGDGLAAALRAIVPDATVEYFPALLSGERVAGDLAAYDHVVAPPGGAGKLGGDALAGAVRHFVPLPELHFHGFHPDQIVLNADGHRVPGATGRYHSRLAVVGFLAGLGVAETASLYGRDAFARLGYFDVFERDLARLGAAYAAHGYDADALLARLRSAGCFMQAFDRPTPAAWLAMAQSVRGAIGAAADGTDADMADAPAPLPPHPVFADIAAALGVAPEAEFHGAASPGSVPAAMSLVEFLRGSFRAYGETDRAVLRGGDGVVEALAALELAESPFGPGLRSAPGKALMTWHGTLLRHAPGAALHLPLHVPAAEAPWLRVLVANDTASGAALAAGGLQARPAWRNSMLALGDDAVFLTADAASAQTCMLRDAVGDCETFLPVSDEELIVLAQLLSGEWLADGALEPLRAALVGGPAVALGDARIDLSQDWPRVLPADSDGTARLAVRLDGADSVLRQTGQPVAPLLLAPRTVPAGERIVLAGEDCFLPLPLTLTNGVRRWLHDTCGMAEGLPWRVAGPRAVISRALDQRMVGAPPPPGAPLTRDAVLGAPVVQIGSAPGENSGWMAPLLRLLTMAPYLESGTAVLSPGDARDDAALAAAWALTGLPAWTVAAAPAGLYTARDVTWIDPAAPWFWPAETLQAARMLLLRGAAAGQGAVFLRGPRAAAIDNSAAVESELAALGFAVLDFAAPADEQLRLLRGAGLVAGVGEDLLAAAFCPDGAKIVELSSDVGFKPEAWLLSCRLRMSHAVLPCAALGEGFSVDAGALAKIVQLVRYRD